LSGEAERNIMADGSARLGRAASARAVIHGPEVTIDTRKKPAAALRSPELEHTLHRHHVLRAVPIHLRVLRIIDSMAE